jgi:hypothetical protein
LEKGESFNRVVFFLERESRFHWKERVVCTGRESRLKERVVLERQSRFHWKERFVFTEQREWSSCLKRESRFHWKERVAFLLGKEESFSFSLEERVVCWKERVVLTAKRESCWKGRVVFTGKRKWFACLERESRIDWKERVVLECFDWKEESRLERERGLSRLL